MKKVVAALVVAALVVVIAWRMWPRSHASSPAQPPAARATTASAPNPVRRLSPAERKQLGDRIAAAVAKARTAAAASGSTPAAPAGSTPAGSTPALPDAPDIPLEQVAKPLQDALLAAVPLLADCYEQHRAGDRAAALMTMISDPELGTVIDTDAVTDGDGQPLERKLDTCLRDVIDSLALPPLGVPGKLKLQYTFRFDQ
jgi:hypothetical protein